MKAKSFFLCFSVFIMILYFPCLTFGEKIKKDKMEEQLQKTSLLEVGALVSKNFLDRSFYITKWDGLHYSEACTAYGVMKYAKLVNNNKLLDAIVARYKSMLIEEGYNKLIPNRFHVDDFVIGIIPLEIYRQTKDKRFLKIGKDLADRQWENPRDDGLTQQTRWWIDDMYMIGSLQIQAYRATGDPIYADRAACQLLVYINKLQQKNGLFRHGETSPFYWGRGNGWVASSLTEVLYSLPEDHPDLRELMAAYKKMMDALVRFQKKDGMWCQIIDNKNFWAETSCTAMFAFALQTGVKEGWLKGEKYQQAAKKGYIGLLNYLDKEGNISDVCQGTGQSKDINYYYDRKRITGDLHGQGPLLWLINSLLE